MAAGSLRRPSRCGRRWRSRSRIRASARAAELVLLTTLPSGRPLANFLTGRAEAFLRALKLSGCELSVSLVGDRRIRTLNRDWRKKDKATDVLSFPAGDWPAGAGARPLGDVVLSLPTAKRMARALGHSVEDELARYLAHGLLHLLGHDHVKKADARKMARAEARLLGRAGMLG